MLKINTNKWCSASTTEVHVQGLLLICRSMNENFVLKSTKIVASSFRVILNSGLRKTVLCSCSQVGKGTWIIPILEIKLRGASGLSLALWFLLSHFWVWIIFCPPHGEVSEWPSLLLTSVDLPWWKQQVGPAFISQSWQEVLWGWCALPMSLYIQCYWMSEAKFLPGQAKLKAVSEGCTFVIEYLGYINQEHAEKGDVYWHLKHWFFTDLLRQTCWSSGGMIQTVNN